MSSIKESESKKSFSLIELIVALLLLSFISYFAIHFYQPNSLDIVSNRLLIYLKQVRLQAFINDKYKSDEQLWHKKRWTLKFFRCRASVGGIYYVIYSDENVTGHPSSVESLKDPLTKKYIYSSNTCTPNELNSSYVLLTQQYDIADIKMSCNSTSSLGQLSFGADGRVYSKLSSVEGAFYEYEINAPCIVKIIHKNGTYKEIVVENRTGYSYKK